MAEDREHIRRDTEEDTIAGKMVGRMMRKEEEHAEAEERPIYPTAAGGEEPRVKREKKRPRPKEKD
ncbi:MAG: hypothetical protein IBX64_11465 [Actinobacteria bacterium]|nr:hypothetical protein [Actinomycetota bacterium]